jgi:phosphate transport system substrate-binding protein
MFRLLAASFLVLPACSRPDPEGDAASGKPVVLQVKGSDTMVNLAQRLSEEYSKVNPKVVVAVTGGGSGTGIKAIIDKTTDMANSSRPMKDEEKEQAAKANGTAPFETTLAFDGLSIYVHRDNPITSINFDQLKAIYSSEGTMLHWKELGVTMDCGNGDDMIVKVGRQNNSGTYEYFKEHVIGKEGKFTSTMDQSGTQQVVDVVGTTKCAIGYGGMGYHNEGTKHLCLAKSATDTCVEPSEANVLSGVYPFSRGLFVYTNGEPTGATKEFLDWSRSAAARPTVAAAGFVPVP